MRLGFILREAKKYSRTKARQTSSAKEEGRDAYFSVLRDAKDLDFLRPGF
jgi:hypothetical protein